MLVSDLNAGTGLRRHLLNTINDQLKLGDYVVPSEIAKVQHDLAKYKLMDRFSPVPIPEHIPLFPAVGHHVQILPSQGVGLPIEHFNVNVLQSISNWCFQTFQQYNRWR